MNGRCCYEADMEAIQICHDWNTPFQIVRTKFDVDMYNFRYDHPDTFKELFKTGKCTPLEIARCLRKDMTEELMESLLRQGIARRRSFVAVSYLRD